MEPHQALTATPYVVYAGSVSAGNISGPIITAHSVTTTGCMLRFFNAGSTTVSMKGNVNLLIIGSK